MLLYCSCPDPSSLCTIYIYIGYTSININNKSIILTIIILKSYLSEINNNFFAVTIDLMSSVVSCRFLNQQDRTLKSCSIMYNRSESCRVDDALHLSRFRQISQDTSNTVVIGLPFVKQLDGNRTGTFCFVVSATNATYTAMISGAFNIGNVLDLTSFSVLYCCMNYPPR